MSDSPTLPASVEGQRLVLVTGPSGAGRSTAINALEDIGYEAIDNLPITLLPRLLDGPPIDHPMALGVDVRNRDFSTTALIDTIDNLGDRHGIMAEVFFLDCSEEVLIRRYSETRRRHPLSPAESPMVGIRREIDLLVPIRARADILVDTSDLTPHELRAEVESLFAPESGQRLAISVHSFSYKRGVPRGVDMIFDCRFLRNPYWEPKLRNRNGQDNDVREYVASDPRFVPFFDKVEELALMLLPAYIEEGKAHLSIGFGCTGGQHRSVSVAERLAEALAKSGWQVSIRHRELERRAQVAPEGKRGNEA
ncbi:RNase adapter RapZ [Aliiroseovarius sp. YM-037]|uniref:RNase adapter RapZ n=1 Tax=Aliiroseovarius sp. YM-037 TaxID=3341728 RepID=UPI003A8067E7